MDTNVYSLIQSQRATDVVVTEYIPSIILRQDKYNIMLDNTQHVDQIQIIETSNFYGLPIIAACRCILTHLMRASQHSLRIRLRKYIRGNNNEPFQSLLLLRQAGFKPGTKNISQQLRAWCPDHQATTAFSVVFSFFKQFAGTLGN